MGPDVPRATWVRGPPPGASSSRPRFFCEVLPTWAPGARTAALLHWPRAGSGRLGRCLTVRTWRGAVPALERPRPPRQRPLSRVCGTRALLRPDNDRGPCTPGSIRSRTPRPGEGGGARGRQSAGPGVRRAAHLGGRGAHMERVCLPRLHGQLLAGFLGQIGLVLEPVPP
jgi:hypothetical protein